MKSKDEYKVRRWLGDRYHLNTEITFEEDKTKIESWKLFRVYPGWMEDNSKAIMTSETNTDKELIKFAKKNRIYDLSYPKMFVIISWLNIFILIINSLLFKSALITGFYYGICFVIIITSIIYLKFLNHNSKIEVKESEEKMTLLKED